MPTGRSSMLVRTLKQVEIEKQLLPDVFTREHLKVTISTRRSLLLHVQKNEGVPRRTPRTLGPEAR